MALANLSFLPSLLVALLFCMLLAAMLITFYQWFALSMGYRISDFRIQDDAAPQANSDQVITIAISAAVEANEKKDDDAFAAAAAAASDGDKTTCPVCLAELSGCDGVRMLPECAHCFHEQCIDAWLDLQSTCPVCRAKVEG